MRESSMLELQSRTSNTILVINLCLWEQIPVLIPSFKVLLQVYAAFPQEWGMRGVVRLIQVRNIEARNTPLILEQREGDMRAATSKATLRLMRLKFLWYFLSLLKVKFEAVRSGFRDLLDSNSSGYSKPGSEDLQSSSLITSIGFMD